MFFMLCSFLGLRVHLSKCKIITDLYINPADRQQRLHFFISLKSYQIKRFIINIQAPKVRRISSEECYFRKHLLEMKKWFLGPGYPKKLAESEMKIKLFTCL